ncbi:MAG: lipocalin-like domain-containing protein [Desulfatitalea sp.]|nr:lipocalin-like domain-containing protein [Desulfatitalea sp.]
MQNLLVGVWALESFEIINKDGDIINPYGEQPIGYLLYTDSGYMSVTIMNRERERCDAENFKCANPYEKTKAAETYFSYCGRYEIQGDTVLHDVEISLFPNWVGTVQDRIMKIEGNSLLLFKERIKISNVNHAVRLRWRRQT